MWFVVRTLSNDYTFLLEALNTATNGFLKAFGSLTLFPLWQAVLCRVLKSLSNILPQLSDCTFLRLHNVYNILVTWLSETIKLLVSTL